MIISHSKKFIFIHNPKAGGTYIKSALGSYVDLVVNGFAKDEVSGSTQILSHLPAVHYESLVRRYKERGYFVFGFVRNPVYRFASAIGEFQWHHSEACAEFGVQPLLSFLLTPSSVRTDWRLSHFRPQLDFFNEDIHVYRLEDVDEWKSDLKSRLGVTFSNNATLRQGFNKPQAISERLESVFKLIYANECSELTRLFGYHPLDCAYSSVPDYNFSVRVEAFMNGRTPQNTGLNHLGRLYSNLTNRTTDLCGTSLSIQEIFSKL